MYVYTYRYPGHRGNNHGWRLFVWRLALASPIIIISSSSSSRRCRRRKLLIGGLGVRFCP